MITIEPSNRQLARESRVPGVDESPFARPLISPPLHSCGIG
jgi:hypothetical protein